MDCNFAIIIRNMNLVEEIRQIYTHYSVATKFTVWYTL